MNDIGLAILGTILIGSQTLAAVSWIEVGHIAVHDQGERFMRDLVMPAPVERIRLQASGKDVFCRSIQADFINGDTRDIFQGLLLSNTPKIVDLPDSGAGFQDLTFQCGTLVRGSAQIDVFADVGRYRDQWSNTASSLSMR